MVTVVGISRDDLESSTLALRMALLRAKPGDKVIASHFPEDIVALRSSVVEKVKEIAAGEKKDGVDFETFLGEQTVKPLQSFVGYLKETSPDFVYIGNLPDAAVRQVEAWQVLLLLSLLLLLF